MVFFDLPIDSIGYLEVTKMSYRLIKLYVPRLTPLELLQYRATTYHY